MRERERKREIVGGAARWTAVELDGQLTLISVHMPHKGRKLGEFEATLTELQEFLNGRHKQHVILGGDFNVNLFGMTDYLHVGESIPRPRTLIDTNDSLRARALHTMVTELDLTVTNTWMNADTERELFTRSSWSNPEDLLTQMDFIMTSRKLEMKHVQVLDSDWFKTDHRAVYAVLSVRPKMRYTMKNAANLRGWVPDESWHDAAAATLIDWKSWNKVAPLLVETAMAHRRVESKRMTVTEMELKTLLLRKKKTGRYLERSELNWLCREIWRKRRALKRETPGQDQGECRVRESSQENAEQAFQLEINCEGRRSQVCSHKVLPRPLLNLRRTGGVYPIRKTTLGGAVEKHENRLCWWNVDLAQETGKCPGETEKRERLTGSSHSRCVESFAPRMFGKDGEVVVADVLEHGFSGRLAVFVDGDGSESGGCNVLDQVQAYCWTVCDAKSLGLRLAQVTPSTEIRKCANYVCAGDTRSCWSVSAVEGGGTVSRMAERDCSGTTGREEGVRPCGPSSCLQGNEIARCGLVLDGLDCGNLEWKLHEGMLGNSDIKQSSDEPRIASRSAGTPSHLHDDHGIGAARLDKELDFTETDLEIGRLHAGCDLLCGRCGADCCIGVCCRNNGVRGNRKTERCWIDGWCTKNTLDEFPEDGGQKHHGGRIGCGVGGSSGVCGIDGVSRWECKTCNRTQNSSSQQMPCKMETCVEFSMAPQIAAAEHRKNYDVAGLSLELECLDDGQGTERQNCELERENGGECCWGEKNRQAWSWDSGGDSGTGLVIAGSRNAI